MEELIKNAFYDELSKIAEHPLDSRKIEPSLPRYMASGAVSLGFPALDAALLFSLVKSIKNKKFGLATPHAPAFVGGAALLGIPYGAYKYHRDTQGN